MKHMYFLISPNCNLKCSYCFQLGNTPEKPDAIDYHHQARVVADKKVIDGLVAYCRANEITNLEIFGGEPLFYRETFKQVVTALCDHVPGITIGVITNGTLITEEIMRLFETRPISILLSLDGGRERHNQFRGGFDRISPWFPRLAAQGHVSVALQAGQITGLYENIHEVWSAGFSNVYINIIENDGWYNASDVESFEQEYEQAIEGMLRGEGNLNCVSQLYASLKTSRPQQGCGIIYEGLACDWHGKLYPCHRAMEIGPQFAIGSIFDGVDASAATNVRDRIHRETFNSPSAQEFPLVSYCPVAVYQKHGEFAGPWSREYCRIIDIKTKLVAKHYLDLAPLLEGEADANDCASGPTAARRHSNAALAEA